MRKHDRIPVVGLRPILSENIEFAKSSSLFCGFALFPAVPFTVFRGINEVRCGIYLKACTKQSHSQFERVRS
jgi:hypothetical protein